MQITTLNAHLFILTNQGRVPDIREYGTGSQVYKSQDAEFTRLVALFNKSGFKSTL